MMNEKIDEETKSYVDLASQTYAMIVDAYAQAQQRSLGYGKSVYEILTRPYASTAMETTYRENFDRANQIVELSVSGDAAIWNDGRQARPSARIAQRALAREDDGVGPRPYEDRPLEPQLR